MSSFQEQQNIVEHEKKKSMVHAQEEKQSIETVSEKT